MLANMTIISMLGHQHVTFFIGICNEDRRNINDYQDLYHEIHVEAYGEDD